MEVTLLIGAAPYTLDEQSAHWLERTIRERYSDDAGRALLLDELDAGGRDCVLLADVLADDLAAGECPQPIELGSSMIGALTSVVLRDYLPGGGGGLSALYRAMRRYLGDPIDSSGAEAGRFERADGSVGAFAPVPPYREIVSLEEWRQHAPPFSGDRHWVDGRSAKETAKACLAGGLVSLPAALGRLLDSHRETAGFRLATVLPEWRTSLTDRGGPRRHDLLLLGMVGDKRVMVGVEAKTDEPFDDPLRGRVARARRLLADGVPTRQLDRLDLLTRAAFGKHALTGDEIRPELATVPYQLLAGLVATALEAERRGSDLAAFCILAFNHERLDSIKLEANTAGFATFLEQLARRKADAVDGELGGPFGIPGADLIPAASVLIGAVTQPI